MALLKKKDEDPAVTSTPMIDKSTLDMFNARLNAFAYNYGLKMSDLDSKEPEPEEWIWVNGYKGTDKNMQCHDGFQYELGKQYDMPEDAEIKVCSSGFHLCLNLHDVTSRYYPIGSGNRFFRVRALVRKNDISKYGTTEHWGLALNDKLAAKSIEFISELTPDVILASSGADKWPDEYKKMAIEVGINGAENLMQTRALVDLGYSEPFAGWIIKTGKYEKATIVTSQPGLSMDMRAFMIMNM